MAEEKGARQSLAAFEMLLGGASYGFMATTYKLAYAAGYSWQEVVAAQAWTGCGLFVLLALIEALRGTKLVRLPLHEAAKLMGLGALSAVTSSFYCFSMTRLEAPCSPDAPLPVFLAWHSGAACARWQEADAQGSHLCCADRGSDAHSKRCLAAWAFGARSCRCCRSSCCSSELCHVPCAFGTREPRMRNRGAWHPHLPGAGIGIASGLPCLYSFGCLLLRHGALCPHGGAFRDVSAGASLRAWRSSSECRFGNGPCLGRASGGPLRVCACTQGQHRAAPVGSGGAHPRSDCLLAISGKGAWFKTQDDPGGLNLQSRHSSRNAYAHFSGYEWQAR
jgi:hypothetical protein